MVVVVQTTLCGHLPVSLEILPQRNGGHQLHNLALKKDVLEEYLCLVSDIVQIQLENLATFDLEHHFFEVEMLMLFRKLQGKLSSPS